MALPEAMSAVLTGSTVEDAALAWLEGVGWQTAHGQNTAPDMPAGGRRDSGDVVRAQRLCDSLLPKLISGQLRLPAAVRDRVYLRASHRQAAQAGVQDTERFVVEAT